MRSEVCDLLARWPRVRMVTGVPSSGREYDEFSSPGFDTSVASSVGVPKLVVSVSVGAGSGGTVDLLSAPIVPVCCGGTMGAVVCRSAATHTRARDHTHSCIAAQYFLFLNVPSPTFVGGKREDAGEEGEVLDRKSMQNQYVLISIVKTSGAGETVEENGKKKVSICFFDSS